MRTLGIVLTLSVASCEDMMKVDTTTGLQTEDNYNTKSEIYGAFIGLAGSFAQVAEQTVVLAGLKGDLMTPTTLAPEEFWDIFTYRADNNTTYTSSRRYYDLVLNCNDFLRRVQKYNHDIPGDIPEAIYKGMVSCAINYKVWSWLTIGKFWGEATIYSSNLVDDNTEGMVRLSFEQLPQYLMDYMNGGEEGIDAFHELDWKLVLDNPDLNWMGTNLDGRVLMGELNMWAGNYQEAIDIFLNYMVKTEKYGNAGYSYIFTHEPTDVGNAVITAVAFSAANGQEHNLRRLFSPVAPNLYYLAPTDLAIQLFESQVQSNYGKGDYSRGNGVSYTKHTANSTTQSYISKYTLNENKDEYTSDAAIYIYRVSELNLMIAEAYCFLGRFEEALVFMDEGVDDYWTGGGFRAPFTDLDQALQKDRGVRDRAGLLKLDRDTIFQACVTTRDSMYAVSSLIADETALEYAYEGKRWPVLMRMAMHLEDNSFLSERVSRKFGTGAAYYEEFLNDRKNWFIPDVVNSTQK